jgi:CTP:molybdopterin cytidylyltransferase MocA
MGASLRAGLAHLEPGDDDLALVTLVDLPDVGAAVVSRVLAAAVGDGRAALARASYDGVPGHPVAIGRDHWAAVITTARGDRGARDHLRATPHHLVECGDLATGRDLDTAGDLDDLQRG